MNDGIVPDQWADELRQSFIERFLEADRFQARMAGIDLDNLETVEVEKPLNSAWLQARKQFQKRWDRLLDEGFRAGFLHHDHCYECSGPIEITTNTTEWVSEPNPEFDPTKPKLEPLDVKFTYGMKHITLPKEKP